MEQDLQPAIVEHLGRLAEMAREDEAFWAALVSDRMAVLARRDGERIGIRCADLLAPAGFLTGQAGRAAQRALAGRMVRGLVAALPGNPRPLAAQHVEQVLHLASECPSGRRTELPRALVERSFDWLWFEPADLGTSLETQARPAESKTVSSSAREFARSVHLGRAGEVTTIPVPEIGRCFRLKVIDWPLEARETSLRQGAIDGELLHPPLLLRSWRPGDTLLPQGRRRPLKLKQLLREGRIAVRERQCWPVLTSAGTLVWVRGLPVAAGFSPGGQTRTGVLITEEAM
jgi:tRNA(Ile)-lysidine synthetase-like protein